MSAPTGSAADDDGAPDTPTTVLPADDAGIGRAAALLEQGALVAFPTETVYGLGARADDADAVARVFAAKRRPSRNPLIVHVPDDRAAFRLGEADERAHALAAQFWPGPLTLVLRRRPGAALAPEALAGGDTVALRVPALPVARTLLDAVGRPLVAPSANPSGRLSPTDAAHVLAGLGGRVAAVLDGGACPIGIESTVVDLARPDGRPALLRPGGIDREALERVLGPLADRDDEVGADGSGRARAPGGERSHYAPRCLLRLDAVAVRPGEALLAFGPDAPFAALRRNLSPTGNLAEAARNLFAALHALDRDACRLGLGRIAVSPIPAVGAGEAIRDRLRRAAAPRAA